MSNTSCKFKTSVGGQALMEGIMMRGPHTIGCAVRKPDGQIDLITEPVKSYWWQKVPLLRGACAMIQSLIVGYRYLMHSAKVSMGDEAFAEEEPTKLEKWITDRFGEKAEDILLMLAAVFGVGLALVLFSVLPTAIVGLINWILPLGDWFSTILEALCKVGIFLGYMVLVSRMQEIRRVFMYHGAEHKTIACYEAGEALTVENIRRHSPYHPRCGTSFLVLIMLISVFLYSALPWGNAALRVVYKILLLPVVMGIGYELLKWCGRSDNAFTRIIRAPGLWVQRLTVFEPTDDMIEVAIAAVIPALPENPEEGKW